MNFFGGKKSDIEENISVMSAEELEELITQKKGEIDELNASIGKLRKQIDKTEKDYREKIAVLNAKQETFYGELEKKNRKNAKDLEKLEKKQEEYRVLHEQQNAEIMGKINVLKAKKKELADNEANEDEAAFERKRKNIEKKLKELRNIKKDEEEQFNARMEEIKSEHDSLIAKANRQGDDLEEKLADTKQRSEQQIADLNRQYEETVASHEEALKQLAVLQDDKEKALRRRQEELIAEKKEELNGCNDQIKELIRQKNEILKELDQSKIEHEREYDSLIRQYEQEKEKGLQENEILSKDIETKNAQLKLDSEKSDSEYGSLSAILDQLIRLLSNTKNAKFDVLRSRVDELEPEVKEKYFEYLGETDEKIIEARSKREKELETLNYNLAKEEELLASRQEFLNTRFKNRDELYRADADKSSQAIKSLEEEIFALKSSSDEKITALKQKLKDAKDANTQVIRNISKNNEDQIRTLKKEYAGRIEAIEAQIAEAKTQIGDMNKQIAQVNQQSEEYFNAYEDKKLTLNDGHEKIMLEINALKAKLDNREKAYEKKFAENNKRSESRSEEIASKIAQIKSLKQKLVDREEEKDLAAYEQARNEIEIRLNQLRQTKKDQGDDFNLRMNQMKDSFEALIADKNGVIENLQKKKQELIEDGDRQVAALEENLAEIRRQHEEKLNELSAQQEEDLSQIKAQEDGKVSSLNNILNSHNSELKQLSDQKNAFLADLEDKRRSNENAFAEEQKQFEAKSQRLRKENEDLEADIDQKEKKLAADIIAQDADYEKQSRELDELIVFLNDSQNEKQADLKRNLNNLNNDLRNRYQNYVADLDSRFTAERNKRESDLATLKYNLEEEEKQLNNRNEFLNVRFAKREELYKNNIAESEKNIASIEEELATLKKRYEEKSALLDQQFEQTKIANEADLKDRQNKNVRILADTRKEYALIQEGINNNIADIKAKIGNINKEILRAQKDSENYYNEYQARKLNFSKDRESYLKNIAERRSELEGKLYDVKQRIEANNEAYNSKVAALQEKKDQVNTDYEYKLSEYKADFDAKQEQLNNEHEFALAEALKTHNEKMDELARVYDGQIAEADADYEHKKSEFENARDSIDSQLEELNNQTNDKIKALDDERSRLLESISKIRIGMENRQNEFNDQIAALEKERSEKITLMAQKQEDDLRKITEEYETIPSRKLQEVRDEFAAKQREYNENASVIASRRQAIDEQEAEEVSRINQEKADADKKLQEADGEYLRNRQEAESLEAELSADLDRRHEELENFRNDLVVQLQQIRDDNAQELEKLTSKLQDEYDDVERQYKEKQTTVENQYEERVKAYRDELKTKKDSLEALIAEIASRRQATEKDCIDRYTEVSEKTKVVQQELDDLVKANEFKRQELSLSLRRKQDMINSEMDNLKTGYANVLSEKKSAYEKYISEVNDKCANLRKEISDLENRKAIELSKLETYENERKTSLADLSRQTRDYISSVSDKIKKLSDQQLELEDAHSKRVYNIKTEIASTMSEYDTLLRSRPELLSDARAEGENDLAARTKLFREKLDSLERSHNEILAGLSAKRNEAVDSISREIGELEAGKLEKLRTYEEEIENLSKAYDVMLKDERDRQTALTAEIRKAKTEQNKFISNMYNDELSISSDYNTEKKALEEMHQKSLEESAQQFAAQSQALKEEFEKLISQRKVLSAEFNSVLDRYKKIDDDISQQEIKLKYECNGKLLEVRKYLEEEQLRRKEKLSILDILKDDNNDLVS
jgi:chromosome segregation ATPase